MEAEGEKLTMRSWPEPRTSGMVIKSSQQVAL